MVLEKKDFELFLSVLKEHSVRPIVREVSSTINGEDVMLYEVIGLDKITEYILTKEMEAKK